ncbi:MAG: LPS-assembly protein LptD [Flavobacteriaceae bacterium]|nr:LPS-assembly protein LptD [Flavobacteriaceae bacterium]
MGFNAFIYSQETTSDSDSLSIHKEKTFNKQTDTLETQKPKANKSTLTDIIKRYAKGINKLKVTNNEAILIDEAKINYQNIEITAGQIAINYNTKIIKAKGILDSAGVYSQVPVFKESGVEYTQDSLVYNYITKKAIIYGSVTDQDGIITLAEKTKKVNDSIIYAQNLKFTSDKKKNPDFYMYARRAKIIPGKKIIVGFTNLYIADVPTPLFVPFGYFPTTSKRKSGIIMPTPGESREQGYYLQNGGYYFAMSDYLDLTILGDVFTNGSWNMNMTSNYKKRYSFNGSFSYRTENSIRSIPGFDDYTKATNYNIRWSHRQDTKASPHTRFSASVNLGSSTYYKQSVNQLNSSQVLSNTLSSSISFYQKILETPFNYTISANHSQNTNTKVISLTLPSFQLNMDRIYPFAPKNGTKDNAIENIGLNYSLKSDYRMTTTDEFFFKQEMFDAAKTGVNQSVSMSTSIKLLKHFTLSPNANYKEVWYFDQISKKYNADENIVEIDTINGFNSYREYSGGAGISTSIYGTFNFKKSRLKAIRHTIRPSISYTYKPSFSQYYHEVQNVVSDSDLESEDGYEKKYSKYTQFDQGIYGKPSEKESQTMGFSINNVLEAKVLSRDSTKVGDDRFNKITLLNNLNFSTSYNFVADSLKWSTVSVSAGTALFKKKLNLNLSGSLDPYTINESGTRINTFNTEVGDPLFRLTRATLNLSYKISSKDFGKNKDQNQDDDEDEDPYDTANLFGEDYINNVDNFDSEGRQNKNKKGSNKSKAKQEFYRSDIPWSLSLSYSTSYKNGNREDEIVPGSLMFNGNIDLTPNWKVNFSSGYDIKNKGFTRTNIGVARDLDSWKMTFNWVPFGSGSTYNFFIGVKSPVFSDIKWDKTKRPDRVYN